MGQGVRGTACTVRRLLPTRDLDVRERVVYRIQRANRRLNTSYLELIHQQCFLSLADRTPWLTSTPLASPSGGTAGSSLLYVLLCVLSIGRPRRLLELGVGQSSVLLRDYVRSADGTIARAAVHVDDSLSWLSRMAPADRGSVPVHGRLKPSRSPAGASTGTTSTCREGLSTSYWSMAQKRAKRATRYNRVGALQMLPVLSDECVVIIDDADRVGERLLVRELLWRCASTGIALGTRRIVGANTQVIPATPAYSQFLYL